MHSKKNYLGKLTAGAKRYAPTLAIAVIAAAVLAQPDVAHASSSGASLPWEGPLDTLKRSITGPVAMIVSLFGIVVCGAALIFGGELNEFVRKMIMLVLAIALIVGAASMLSTLFGVGALIVPPVASLVS